MFFTFFNSGRASSALTIWLFLLLSQSAPVSAQWKVGEIKVEGNKAIKSEEILDRITLKKSKPYAEWITEDDRSIILSLYRSRGFLEADVKEFSKKINIENQTVNITIQIDEGRQTILKSIEITGNTVFATKDLLNLEDIIKSKPLDGRKVSLLRQKILNRYLNRGYLYAEVKERHYFPAGNRNAEMYLDIDEGKQVKVGSIEIRGNKKIRTSIILRGLEISPGSVYTEEKMHRSRSNLYRLGILRDIRHELPGLEEKKEVINVVIYVTEGDFHASGVGAGIGDVDGLRGYFEWGHYNLFNSALGLSQLTRITYQPFEKNPTYKYSFSSSLTLRQPYFLKSRIEASTTGLFGKISYAYHEEEKLGINALFRNMVTERKELSFLVELNTRLIFNVDTAAADKSIIDNMGRKVTNLISPFMMFDQRDDRFNPERGYQLFIKSSLAGGPLLFGSINFYLFSIEGSYILPLMKWKDRSPLLFATRLKLGVIREFGRTPSVPPSEAFNIGGAKSLRGYSELSIGPLNDRDVAGNVVMLSNFELRYPIRGNFGGVLFLDAANVFRNLFLNERFHLLTTAGIGLRYRTPVGPLRVDGALKLNNLPGQWRRSESSGLQKELRSRGRIHFGIGHAF